MKVEKKVWDENSRRNWIEVDVQFPVKVELSATSVRIDHAVNFYLNADGTIIGKVKSFNILESCFENVVELIGQQVQGVIPAVYESNSRVDEHDPFCTSLVEGKFSSHDDRELIQLERPIAGTVTKIDW